MRASDQATFDDLDEMDVTRPTMAPELLAKDAHPLQQCRRLTQNAIETIQSTPSRAGTVLWDVDWFHVEHTRVYRLACIDDGRGMAEDETREHLNTLFSSGREQGVAGNFGIGGKVTAGAEEPGGIHDDAPSEIREAVREWYEQMLVEAVLRSWSFEHEAPWQRQQYEQLTSPEALTLAVLPFTFVHEKIKGSVRTRLGALAGSVSA